MHGKADCPAVAEMTSLVKSDNKASHHAPKAASAQETFAWGPCYQCKSKPCDPHKFDPGFELISSGAHVPLLAWVCKCGGGGARRSPKAKAQRAARRWQRQKEKERHGDGALVAVADS